MPSERRVLALSSSRAGDSDYFGENIPLIKKFLGSKATNIAFIPFASVNDYEEYTSNVRKAFESLPVTIDTILPENAKSVIDKNDVIMVGGGNTFKLLHDLYKLDLLDIIRDKVNNGTPYIGWSAGSNITGITIGTTNDMPIIEPESFNALKLFPFQINPHYYNQQIKGFNGETRDQRLEEFIKMNPKIPVVCLPEGTALQLTDQKLKFVGNVPGSLLYMDSSTLVKRIEINSEADLSYLL